MAGMSALVPASKPQGARMTEKTRDSFIFYRSFYQSAKKLPKEDKAELFDAICSYALDGELMDLSVVPEAIFTVIQPNLDANRRRWENGCKEKKKAGDEQDVSKTKANQKQTRSKAEGNKDKDKDVNENKKKILVKSQFEKIYRLFNRGKKVTVVPFGKLKSKFENCLKEITFEELEKNVDDYLDYLSTETWRKKKAFDAWINSSEFFANDWKSESKEEKESIQSQNPICQSLNDLIGKDLITDLIDKKDSLVVKFSSAKAFDDWGLVDEKTKSEIKKQLTEKFNKQITIKF
tara:strand:- start:15 stop:890 length:876 start_codon:yes stop_codon:yes gene_type:complete